MACVDMGDNQTQIMQGIRSCHKDKELHAAVML